MSYAEIKKAINSNLDVPLNKYYINGLNKFSVFPSSCSKLTKIVDVQGGGFLHSAILKDMSSNSVNYELKVEIDGNVLFWAYTTKYNCTFGLTDSLIKIKPSSTFFYVLPYSYRYSGNVYRYSGHTYETEGNVEIDYDRLGQKILSSERRQIIYSNIHVASLDKPLRFNKSLNIYITSPESVVYGDFTYTLDD